MKPKYPHKCLLGGDMGCKFLGQLHMNGSGVWDVYAVCKGRTVLFRYGHRGYEYFATPIVDFPLEVMETHKKKVPPKKGRPRPQSEKLLPTASVINAAWKEASRRWWR